MKNNGHKKLYAIDRFARKYYCQHACLNQLRADKQNEKKAWRISAKKDIVQQNKDEL